MGGVGLDGDDGLEIGLNVLDVESTESNVIAAETPAQKQYVNVRFRERRRVRQSTPKRGDSADLKGTPSFFKSKAQLNLHTDQDLALVTRIPVTERERKKLSSTRL